MKTMKQIRSAVRKKSAKKGKSKTRKGKRNGDERGESKMSAPTTIAYKTVTRPPQTVEKGQGRYRSIRVKHRELINGAVLGNAVFTLDEQRRINPGDPSTFPWLSGVAGLYEEYICHKFSAEFLPIAPTSTQGEVIMSMDYDVNDIRPINEVDISQMEGTVADSCWKKIVFNGDVKAMAFGTRSNRKFVREYNVAGDQRLYDIGKFYLAVNNETSGVAIGKLWFDYDFEFFVPEIRSDVILPQVTNQAGVASQILVNNTFTNVMWGPWDFSNVLNIPNAVTGIITPPPGAYMVTISIYATDSVAEQFGLAARFVVNGANLKEIGGNNLVALAPRLSTSGSLILIMNGADTLEIRVSLTGAAGVLTLIQPTIHMYMA